MKCTEFETVLNELLDSRLDLKSDLRISAHAASCPPCKEELEIYASIAELAPENGTSQLAPAQAILQSPPKTIRQKKREWFGYAVMSSAAALLLVLGPFSDYFFPQNSSPNNVAKAENGLINSPDSYPQPNDKKRLNSNAGDHSATKSQDKGSLKNSTDADQQQAAVPTRESAALGNGIRELSPIPSNSVNPAKSRSPKPPLSRGQSDFWTNNALNPPIQDPFGNFQGAFQRTPSTPDLDDLERVGESLETVWKTIQEDDYILPLVKQGALLLVRRS